jgi:hypothetical protein
MTRLSLVLCLALAAPAAAEPFTLMIYESGGQLALRTDAGAKGTAYWGSYAAFAAEAGAAGILRGGQALVTDPAAIVTTAGPGSHPGAHATSPLALGGYFQIDVADIDAALDWARRLPAATTGVVEVRPGFAAPGM